jgi:hypothetical protein
VTHGAALLRWMMMSCLVATASCNSAEREVRGTVTVNGAPLETGTIFFHPGKSGAGKGAGAAVTSGRFELASDLAPGSYNVVVEGFKKTGRMIADPQRGKVEESLQLKFQGMPVPVTLSAENSDNLQIDLKTAT